MRISEKEMDKEGNANESSNIGNTACLAKKQEKKQLPKIFAASDYDGSGFAIPIN